MKISFDVDCTAEEARRLMGLPDLTPVHDAYVAQLLELMKGGGASPDMLDAAIKSWAPMGESGLRLWQQLIEGATGGKR